MIAGFLQAIFNPFLILLIDDILALFHKGIFFV